MERNIKIGEFPGGDGYWLLTWAAEVVNNGMDFLINVDLVEIDYQQYKREPKTQRCVIKDFGKPRRFVVRGLHIKLMRLLEIGSVWHKKERISSPKDSGADRLTIRIKSGNSVLLSRIESQMEQYQRYHPFDKARGHGLADCLVIGKNNLDSKGNSLLSRIDRLLIPPSELIRYYYCGSGKFISQLFGSGIQHDQVYDSSLSSFNDETQEAYVRLRSRMDDSDAIFIGRIAHSRFAYTKAIEIGKLLNLQLMDFGKAFIRAWLPFETASNLQLTGKYVRIREGTGTDGAVWGFLVYTIEDCSAEFPFRLLWHDRDNDARQDENVLEEREKAVPLSEVRLPESELEIYSDNDVDQSLPTTALKATSDTRFSAAPQVLKAEKDHQKVRTTWKAVKTVEDKSDLGLTDNDPYGEPGAAPATTTDELSESPGDFAQALPIVDWLRDLGYYCHFMVHSSTWSAIAGFRSFPFPEPFGFSAKGRKWLEIRPKGTPGKGKRARKVILVRIVGQTGTHFYYMEIESGPGESFSRVLICRRGEKTKLLDSQLDGVLSAVVQAAGKWRNCDLGNLGLLRQPFDHLKGDTPEDVVKRFKKYIEKMSG